MAMQLNFEAEPFGEYAFSNEGEEEFERPRVRDHRGGGPPATTIARPRRPGIPPSSAFRQGMALGRGFNVGRRFGVGGFGRGAGVGRAFGFRPGVGFPRGPGFGRGFGFGPGLGRGIGFRRRRRFPFLSRFGTGLGRGFGTGVGQSAGFGGGTAAPAAPSPWVTWAQSCLAQILGDWVPQDGTMDPPTRRAIQTFQAQQQLPPTGALDEATMSALQAACAGTGGGGDGGDQGGE